jgi:hypothetical protein
MYLAFELSRCVGLLSSSYGKPEKKMLAFFLSDLLRHLRRGRR